MSKETLTACCQCKHLMKTEDSRESKIGVMWYNLRCSKVEPKDVFDPYLGRWVKGDDKHCREINRDGHCEFFERIRKR